MASFDEFENLFDAAQRQGGVATVTLGLAAGAGFAGHFTGAFCLGVVALIFLAVSMRADDRVKVYARELLHVCQNQD